MKVKNLKTILIYSTIALAIITAIVMLEVKVQKNWDKYEQNYFAEMGLYNGIE